MSVRVRIAPAPSGSLHIGNARTALYNWLFARKHKGSFVLRVEDTDRERVRDEYITAVMDELHWLGLDYDEGPDKPGEFGPYLQSQRLPTYAEAADKLFAEGAAYRCYCTPEELKERRERALAEGRKPGYDGRCRDLTSEERRSFESEGRRWVMRFRVPEGETTYQDLITGEVTVSHREIEDFPIMRQTGYPIYVLGAAVDDALMEITHVIRGMDLQSAAPRQILLLRALGYPVPEYAHIPLVMGEGNKKLSKRYGGGSVEWYRDRGYLADALVNSLVLLGTGFGDDTIIGREEMIERFDLDRVNASPAAFDEEKFLWMNGEYIRMLDEVEMADALVPWCQGAGLVSDPPGAEELALLREVAPLVQTRIKLLSEAPALIAPVFGDVAIDPKALDKVKGQPWSARFLETAVGKLEVVEPWGVEEVEAALREVQESMDLSPRKAFMPIYVAISGTTVSIPIFNAMAIIGKTASLERLKALQSSLD